MKKNKGIDLHKGGKLKCDNGNKIKVEPHSERVYLTVWKGNGAVIEVFSYSERQKGCVESDRIHLVISAAGKERRGWLMNIVDAECIVEGLIVAMREAGNRGVPRDG